ncbi:ovalbumin-related protein Y-like protein, partial [Leptotrombidium deliense]
MCLLAAKNNTEKEMFEAMRYKLGFNNSQEVHTFMKKFLEFWSANNAHVTLNIANRVILNKSDKCQMNPEYSKQLKAFYKAMVDEVDFGTQNEQIVQTCNQWVNEATKGKIPTILDSLEKDAVAVLINAIYFKGSWVHAFDK